MKLRNLSRWKLGPETDGLLFFAQRMDELLFDFTLDTYKPPALNSPFLCVESLELISEIDKGFIEPANLEPVLEELTWSLQHDPIAKSLLDAEISYYTLRNDETSISTTKLRLEVLGRTLNPNRYLEAVLSALTIAVKDCKKSDIDSLTTTLVTTLINIGISKQFLFNLTHEYFFSPDGKEILSSESLVGFTDKINPKMHEYSVYFVVSALIREVSESITAFRLEIVSDVPNGDLSFPADSPKTQDEVFVKVNGIKAPDAFSARQEAYRHLDNLSDLFTLFYHRSQISWRPEALVVGKCCGKQVTVAQPPRGPMEKAFDLRPDRASKELNSMLRNFATRRDKGSFQRFNRVADLHGVCVAHDIAENQLVNLWTAIETLVPSHVGGSKIKQVIKAVLPFVALSYVQRVLENLLFDLTKWDRWRTKKILNKVPAKKGAGFLERLACLMASSECADLRSELYEKLGDFHLLRHRCFRLSESLATSANVISMLDRHEKKVDWQVRRLYRARNLIVHTSRSPSYLNTLIENGHSYLDTMLFDVIKLSCGEYRSITIEQAFELSAISYRKFREKIAGLDRIEIASAPVLLAAIQGPELRQSEIRSPGGSVASAGPKGAEPS